MVQAQLSCLSIVQLLVLTTSLQHGGLALLGSSQKCVCCKDSYVICSTFRLGHLNAASAPIKGNRRKRSAPLAATDY